MISSRIKGLLHNKTVRNGGLFSIFSFFNRGVSFVLLVILAKYIAPAQYGELSLYNTIVVFLGYFIGLSTSGYLSVSYFRESNQQFKRDFTSIFTITTVIGLLLFFLITFFQNYLSEKLKITASFLLIGLAVSYANTFVQLNLDYYRVQEKIIKYGILSCTFALVNFVFSLYLVIQADLNWEGRVYAQLFTEIVYAIIAFAIFFNNSLFSLPDIATIKKVALWGIPLIPHHASVWIKSGLDRYIIESSHSMADVGLFSFALNLIGVLTMIGTAFNQTNSVNLYQTLSSNSSRTAKLKSLHSKERIFALLYLACAIVVGISGLLFVPLLMPKYTQAIPYFLILLFYGYFVCLYLIVCNYLFYFGKTKEIMAITFGSSLLHLGLSLWLTRYSLYYTALIYVFIQLTVAILIFWRSRKCEMLIQ